MFICFGKTVHITCARSRDVWVFHFINIQIKETKEQQAFYIYGLVHLCFDNIIAYMQARKDEQTLHAFL